jgi:5-methylcytosine-specific restriction endonuclease McrA
MSDKRPSSAKARRECFESNRCVDHAGHIFLVCHLCGARIDPARDKWDADHTTPHAFGGTDLKPAHERCHRHKTSKTDVPAIAKSKRVSDRHFGIKRPKGFRKTEGVSFDWSTGRYERRKP